MAESTAPNGCFLFSQHTKSGKCHLSFNSEGDPFNVQIPMANVEEMIASLLRVQKSEREQLECRVVQQADKIYELSQPVAT